MHPILDALDGTPHEWIKKLLFTFNEGNIGKFEALAPLFPKEVRACVCVRKPCWPRLSISISVDARVCVCVSSRARSRSRPNRGEDPSMRREETR